MAVILGFMWSLRNIKPLEFPKFAASKGREKGLYHSINRRETSVDMSYGSGPPFWKVQRAWFQQGP